MTDKNKTTPDKKKRLKKSKEVKVNINNYTMESISNVQINQNSIEPHEYFKVLKGKRGKVTLEILQNQLNSIAQHIISAHKVGQTNLVDRLAFTYDVLIKEQILVANKFNGFVYEDDLKKFLDGVTNIKAIELARYPRFIPNDNIEEIERAKKLKVFDEFCVVFSDYSIEEYKTEEEKKTVERNKDPIVFGYFRNKHTGIKHNRFYFITDWEDEYCDLTFSELIKKMEIAGINNPSYTIDQSSTYLDELLKTTLDKLNKDPISNFAIIGTRDVEKENNIQSFWEKLKFWKNN